jgi:hypothetical protein
MRYVLKTMRLKFRVRKKFTVKDLNTLLDGGGVCIFIYDTSRGGHCVFIDKRVEGGYRAWNRRKGDPPFFSQEDMEKAIKVSTRKAGGLYAFTFQGVID